MPALKAVLAKLDEVDEKYRDLYTERNGKFEFTGVEGLKTQGDVERVTEALRKARTDLTKAQGDLTAANAKLQVWGELDHDDITQKLEKLATYEAGQNVPELMKNFETTVNSRVQAVVDGKVKAETSKLQRTIDAQAAELSTAKTTISTFEVKDQTRTVHDAVRAEAVKSKVIPEAIGDLLVIAGGDLKLVDGKPQTEDGRDVAAWLEDRKGKTPYFWPSATGTGARGDGGGPATGDNPFKRDGHNVTKISQLVSQDPTKAAKFAEQAGVPKNADGTFQWHVMPPVSK